jgi:Zn-finger nucleic acid-binding protein
MDFICPSCNAPLQPQRLEKIRFWKCMSCRGLAISLPTVRKGLTPEAFKTIWQKLSSGETEAGRPCPGCRKPLSVVEAAGQAGGILIDVCRSCQILWFDDNEFSDLPKAEQKTEVKAQGKSEVLTEAELVFAAFKEDQYKRRSFLYKLLDGSVSRELGFDSFFGDLFDE